MTELYSDINLKDDIAAFLDAHGISVNAAAKRMGLPQRTFADFLGGKSRLNCTNFEKYFYAFREFKEVVEAESQAEEVAA